MTPRVHAEPGRAACMRPAAGAAVLAVFLAGCATPPPAVPPPPSAEQWRAFTLPGKRATEYRWVSKDGRHVVSARADRSASMWRRSADVAPDALGEVAFSWRVDDLIEEADLTRAERSDTPARVMFAFGGDTARLSARNRMQYDLAQMLTGEVPPYATLAYVWDRSAPVGTVIVSARSDRVRKLVVESGPEHLGRWRSYRRNLADDFRAAFGEAPGPLVGIALMTDADNTQSRAQAWYGEVTLD